MAKRYSVHPIFKDRTIVIATMHGKERVIAPILERELKAKCMTILDFDTDTFGTFSGEIERKDAPVITLKAKAYAAIMKREEDLVIASEGSFGPHPSYFSGPANEEMVILIDTRNDIEIIGRHFTEKTNFNHGEVKNMKDLDEFVEHIGYPEHGIILQTVDSEKKKRVYKDFKTFEDLKIKARKLLKNGSTVRVETDMRAMNNPTRMVAIELAVKDLVKNIKSQCPGCSAPGFVISDVVRGLLCGTCNFPTKSISAYIYKCKKCGYGKKVLREGISEEDPMYCNFCNP